MKKSLLLIILLAISNIIYGHKQHAHQYITIEGYTLLQRTLLLQYPQLRDNMGIMGGYIGDKQWKACTVSGGAWREDEEDVVYGYKNFSDLIGDGGLKSITHFWDPDDGDIKQNTFNVALGEFLGGISGRIGPYPDAYEKMLKYRDGGWTVRYYYDNSSGCPSSAFGVIQNYPILGLAFEYSNLFDFFKTGKITTKGYLDMNNHWVNCTPVTIYLGKEFCEKITWEILGRMCHLLQDMSVPAHVHRDIHPDKTGDPKDSYEDYFGSDFGFTGLSVYDLYGGFLDPMSKQNPLHFLMYTTAQMADHFGSSGPYEGNGNDILGGNPLADEIAYLNSINVSSLGGYTGTKAELSYEEKIAIRNKMIPQAIRATAGLLYWFAVNAGLTSSSLSLAVSIGGTNNLYRGGSGNWYVTPKNSIPPYTYKWQYKYAGSVVEAAGESAQAAAGETSSIVRLPPPNTWLSIGSDSPTLSIPFNANNLQDFYVRCTVKDGLGKSVTSGSIFVDVINADPPLAKETSQQFASAKELAVEEIIPENYSIFQNYPNPFNPSTIIRYELPEAGNVTLKIYDMLGREVSAIVNEHKEAGRYEAVFNASNLATGIYIYELRTNNFVSIKKMNFVK